MKRVFLIIDAAYLYHIQKHLGHIDLKELRALIGRCYGEIIKCYYITPIVQEEKFSKWLESNGFQIIQKENKIRNCNKCGYKFNVEKGIDVYIAVQMIKEAIKDSYDRLALVNGDGDMIDSIKMIMNDYNKEVYTIGHGFTISNELKTVVTGVLELSSYIEGIAKR